MDGLVAMYRDRELHVILDNLNTHKKSERWLKKHPKVRFHFTPTRSSWLNQIEPWFSILQGQSLAGASFTSIEQLKEHIDAFITAYNETAEPFAWTKKKVYRVQKSPYHSALIPSTSTRPRAPRLCLSLLQIMVTEAPRCSRRLLDRTYG